MGHEYGATAVFDATHHWTKCTRCDVTKSKSAHIWVFDKEITPASFTATGVTRNKCTGCDATQNVEVKQFLYGDVDCDGYIRAADARLCLRQSVGLESFKEGTRQHIACNVDGDDAIRAADARLILRYSVGLETSFPVHN